MSNFTYNFTTILHLEAMLSTDRFETYVFLAKGDKRNALSLYKKNILLSHRFYTIIHILEVCLRNKIDERLKIRHGLNWFQNSNLSLSSTQRSLLTPFLINGKRGQLITSLPFGFWSSFFGRSFEELWRHDMRLIFNRELPIKRSHIASRLKDIRTLRNRIAHHECILKMDTQRLEEGSIELLYWLSPTASKWLKSELLNPSISLV